MASEFLNQPGIKDNETSTLEPRGDRGRDYGQGNQLACSYGGHAEL